MDGFLTSVYKPQTKTVSIEEAEKAFSLKETTAIFRDIGTVVESKLASEILLGVKHFTGLFADLNIDLALEEAIVKAGELASHLSFKTNFWIGFQYDFVIKYLQCLFHSATKKTFQADKVAEKIEKDKVKYIETFGTITGKDTAKDDSEVLDEIRDLLDGNDANIPTICTRLRDKHGDSFNIKIVTVLINMRKDIPAPDKKNLLEQCSKILGPMPSSGDVKGKRKSIFMQLEADDSYEEEEEEKEEEEEEKKDPEEEFDMEKFLKEGGLDPTAAAPQEEEKQIDIPIKAELTINMEGNMMIGGKKRYFRIVGGKLFCYKNSKDTVADSSFPTIVIKDIASVSTAPDNKIILKFQGAKPSVELTTIGSEDPDKWANCIKNNISEGTSASPKKKIVAKNIGSSLIPGKGGVVKMLPSPPMQFEIKEPGSSKGKKGKKGKSKKKKSKFANSNPPPVAAESKGCCWCFFKNANPDENYHKIN